MNSHRNNLLLNSYHIPSQTDGNCISKIIYRTVFLLYLLGKVNSKGDGIIKTGQDTFYAAKLECESVGLSLPSFKTSEEYQEFTRFLRHNDIFTRTWLDTESFKPVDDQQPDHRKVLTFWSNGEPNHLFTDSCIRVEWSAWKTTECSSRNAYLCATGYTGNDYTLQSTSSTFDEAIVGCREIGKELVVIKSEEQWNNILDYLKNVYVAVWIGLRHEEGYTHKWLNGKTVVGGNWTRKFYDFPRKCTYLNVFRGLALADCQNSLEYVCHGLKDNPVSQTERKQSAYFFLESKDKSGLSKPILEVKVRSGLQCSIRCFQNEVCVMYSFNGVNCQLFNTTDTTTSLGFVTYKLK